MPAGRSGVRPVSRAAGRSGGRAGAGVRSWASGGERGRADGTEEASIDGAVASLCLPVRILRPAASRTHTRRTPRALLCWAPTTPAWQMQPPHAPRTSAGRRGARASVSVQGVLAMSLLSRGRQRCCLPVTASMRCPRANTLTAASWSECRQHAPRGSASLYALRGIFAPSYLTMHFAGLPTAQVSLPKARTPEPDVPDPAPPSCQTFYVATSIISAPRLPRGFCGP